MEINAQSGRSGQERNREERSKITLDCEVRQGARPWKVTRLEDMSPNGFCIAWFPNCRPEIPIRIRIPGLQLLTANVRWQKDTSVGCEFDAPLHVAVFEHLIAQAGQG